MKRLIAIAVALFAASCAAPQPGDNASAGERLEAANLATVKKLYADSAGGDVDAFTAAFADDVVWNEAESFPYADGNPYVGAPAIMAGVFARIREDWTYFRVTPEDFLADGERVVMFGRYEGEARATGRAMNPQVVHVWTLHDGKVARFQQYADTAATLAALRD